MRRRESAAIMVGGWKLFGEWLDARGRESENEQGWWMKFCFSHFFRHHLAISFRFA
jgi:hypothetical protein